MLMTKRNKEQSFERLEGSTIHDIKGSAKMYDSDLAKMAS